MFAMKKDPATNPEKKPEKKVEKKAESQPLIDAATQELADSYMAFINHPPFNNAHVFKRLQAAFNVIFNMKTSSCSDCNAKMVLKRSKDYLKFRNLI